MMMLSARMTVYLACAVLGAMAMPSIACAQGYEGGNWRVVGYRVGAEDMFALDPAPQACGGGSNYGEHIAIPADVANRQEIVASLMSAYLTGERVSGLWFANSGPCNASVALSVFMIRMARK